MIDAVCPACSAPLQLVWVHGHGQCANCSTTIVPCCTGVGQEVDEQLDDPEPVEVDDVLRAFGECSGGSDATTFDSLVLTLHERLHCTHDAATAAIARAVALHRLSLHGKVVRRHA
jgi:hypothetical protein